MHPTAPSPLGATPSPAGWQLEHTYAALPASLHVAVAPTPVAAPRLVILNRPLAEELGLDPEMLVKNASVFAGNELPPGAAPLAQAYAGHQYGRFTILGDGRAILLGEQRTPRGERFDIQLKGSGPTPFSRRGDGRAPLAPMLREYVISEAMHALGIPTTRSLAVATTGEEVLRQGPRTGAVLTRVARSHIRVGTFEGAAAHRDTPALQALLTHTLERHFPAVAEEDNPALALLGAAVDQQAALVARWMLVGFIHGVMNTDNMALSGETIDYGPCAFLDAYDPTTVFSSIDRHGRYAYGNQPAIAQWNLACLAEALLPLLDADEGQAIALATEVIEAFPARYEHHWQTGMARKLGLFNEEAADAELYSSLLAWMQTHKADFTNTFRALSASPSAAQAPLSADAEFRAWKARWDSRRDRQPQSREASAQLMRAHTPAFIPRNHKVEEALAAAEDRADLTPLKKLLEILARPYDDQPEAAAYAGPAASGEGVYQTFCGT